MKDQWPTQRIFARDQIVVVAQQGVWRAVDNGAFLGEAALASLFRVAQGQVFAFARYDDLETALAAAELTSTVMASDQES